MSGREVISLILLFAVALVDSDETPDMHTMVKIDGTKVTLTCPGVAISWNKDMNDLKEFKPGQELIIEEYNDKHNGLYYCAFKDSDSGKDSKHYFYTKLKVCEGCVEMDMSYGLGIVIGDIMITVGVIILIYMCAKKKAGPAPHQRAAHSRQTGAPPPPEPDYQSLNQATRSRDVYAEARRKN